MPPRYIWVCAVVWAYGRGQTDRHTHTHTDTQTRVTTLHFASSTTHAKCNKSSAVAEMGDRGHNRHGPKRGGCCAPFHGALGTRLIQCGLRRGLLPYQVASSSIQPFGHNSVGCHSPRRNISTNYYLVVEMHAATVCSGDARYLLK